MGAAGTFAMGVMLAGCAPAREAIDDTNEAELTASSAHVFREPSAGRRYALSRCGALGTFCLDAKSGSRTRRVSCAPPATNIDLGGWRDTVSCWIWRDLPDAAPREVEEPTTDDRGENDDWDPTEATFQFDFERRDDGWTLTVGDGGFPEVFGAEHDLFGDGVRALHQQRPYRGGKLDSPFALMEHVRLALKPLIGDRFGAPDARLESILALPEPAGSGFVLGVIATFGTLPGAPLDVRSFELSPYETEGDPSSGLASKPTLRARLRALVDA